MSTIAFLGLGHMGGPMAANLVKAGHAVRGFDPVPAACEHARSEGVAIAPSAVEAVTGADVVKTVVISKATRDLRSRLMPSSSVQAKMGVDELKQLQQFVDLLDKCMMLDPVRRISPREALLHPFVTGQRAA